ncbi:MAG: hypothetical protein R2911_45350 [Caldilineaceae bacterium]
MAAQLNGPIAFNEFAEHVLALWPTKAKNPQNSVRDAFRYGIADYGLTYLDDKRQMLMPLAVGLRGVQFRHVLTQPEIDARTIFLDLSFWALYGLRMSFQKDELTTIQFLDENGQPLSTEPNVLKREVDYPPFGKTTVESRGLAMADWFQAHNAQVEDSVLFTVDDWAAKRFRLRHEPRMERREEVIQTRNAELMDMLYRILESATSKDIESAVAIPAAYMRLADPTGYPGDPLLEVFAADGRMLWNGSDIRYASKDDFFYRLLDAVEPAEEEEIVLTEEEANQVYCFKCVLKYRKGLWRRIEIMGGQTLRDFNWILIDAFGHDADHMGGFWHRVRRGASKRFREIDLGSVDPFGGGDGAHVTIAEIGLQQGEELKYVFDFGDWYEHILTLEEIVPAAEVEPAAEYPRILDQNRPRYKYCRHCRAEGRQSVATWICIECSDAEQEAVMVCDDCLTKHHEEHYANEYEY